MASNEAAAVELTAHADHFVDAAHERRAAQFGMWLFLANEILLFGPLFTAFALYRYLYRDTFAYLSAVHLDWKLGTVNTVVLLVSSFTVVVAGWAARCRRSIWVGHALIATIVLAGGFLVVKYFEYTHKFHEGLLPGKYFTLDLAHDVALHMESLREMGLNPAQMRIGPGASMFFALYFLITGLHGLHVVIGMGVLGWMAVRAYRGEFAVRNDTPVELSGLYWHLVDLIWIFVYPTLYLL
ncbi:MAG: cytochrome c oxidase subunit 3 family protein [Myxococcaceae bacterium]|nr:cytochrome c oxidase subunit 3 family protein [Myxococcaceae bacterium]